MHEWDLLARVFVEFALATKPGTIARMFGLSVATAREAIEELASDGAVRTDVAIEGLPGRFVTSMGVR